MNEKVCYIIFICGLSACSSSTLSPFHSDGCSLFPDTSLITQDDWSDCCFQHDIAYWRGGTAVERKAADQRLHACVKDKTGNAALARIMYDGVRFGGSPYFYNWYRWGYGWGYDRKYQSLTGAEQQQADALLQAYLAKGEKVCDTTLQVKPEKSQVQW